MQEAASREDEKNRGQMADMATSINTLEDNSRKMAETVDGLVKTVMGLSDTLTGTHCRRRRTIRCCCCLTIRKRR
jgi:hypothetical protein